MSAGLGFLGTMIAVVAAALLTFRGFAGVFRPERSTAGAFRLPAIGLLVGAGVAMLALEIGLLADDFSVAYIANNSASTTPFLYKVASAWAALEGSLVLWGLVLAGFVFAVWVVHARRGDEDPLGAGAYAVMGLISLFFFVIMATISNPFEVCTATQGIGCGAESGLPWAASVMPVEGLGPNPLLQNHPLMAIHPPMLYVGYVGLTVPFAFAISALLRGESGDGWLRRTRSWTLVAWVFLTAGIVLGGLWSYEVLGWGGYWAWDPVENASFMPWLASTAFLHSSAVQLRRGVLQAWNFVLVITAFSLTILGTFLTRSGVIVSVHSFTQSPIGPALLWFLMIILVGSLGLFAMRAHLVSSSPRLDSLASREGVFLVNNLLLAVFAFVVLIGTLYPMIIAAVTGDEVGVGRPFYDRIAVPLSYLLILAMGIGPFTPYRSAKLSVVWERVRTPLRIALAVAALAVLLGTRNGWILISIVAATYIVTAAGRQLIVPARVAAAKKETPLPRQLIRTLRSDPPYWGGQVAHIGVAVLALGIALSANLSAETEVDLVPGETVQFADFNVTYVAPFNRAEPHRTVIGAEIEVRRGDKLLGTLEPRLNQYQFSQQSIASPAVDHSWRGDLYVSLAALDQGGLSIEMFWFPYVWLVWAGGFLTAGGGVYSWLVKRPARSPKQREAADA